jgi:hypothetical protein
MTGYKNKHGQVLFVSPLLGENKFATVTQKPTGSIKRFCSKLLPVRDKQDQAEWDLAKYARITKMKKIEIPEGNQ